MAFDLQDTIAAIASPPGPSQRGIIRVSGTNAVSSVAALFQPDHDETDIQAVRLPTRVSGHVQPSLVRVPIPAAVMLWPTNRSYTGQPMVEIHMIGSPPLLDSVLETLFNSGVRSANRGEFTMRAFMAGRIDLVQAEAVLGVIDAADHEELQTALTQLGGGITSKLADVRSEILSLLGDLEAGLDFVEEDIEFISKQQICDRLDQCLTLLSSLAGDSETRLSSGYVNRIVLAGLPNAGKSTLFNSLIGTGKAIVSPVAGTTRDYLIGHLAVNDLQLQLIDTAGWEIASDLIMEQAQGQREQQLGESDLVLWCRAADLNEHDAREDQNLRQHIESTGTAVLTIVTRIDLNPNAANALAADAFVSATTSDGIQDLLRITRQHFSSSASSRSELLASTAARCRETLGNSTTAIEAAIQAALSNSGDEIIAMELRDALQHIGVILGEVYTDDILDHIFSNFCIGK